MRAAVHSYLPVIKTGWDIILIARAPLVDAEWPRVLEALNALLKRAHLLENRK